MKLQIDMRNASIYIVVRPDGITYYLLGVYAVVLTKPILGFHTNQHFTSILGAVENFTRFVFVIFFFIKNKTK